MPVAAANPSNMPAMKDIQKMIAPYQRSDSRQVTNQLLTSVLPYLVLWPAILWLMRISFWAALPLIVLAAGFMVRTFIIFHDCGHNSFFRTAETNRKVGFWLGVLVFTPGEQWWHAHAVHHASAGNLDKRGVGDVETLTVAEYRQLPPLRQLGYRLFRHPLVMFLLGPVYMFLISHRFAIPHFGKKETQSVWQTNGLLLVWAVGLSLLAGSWQAYVLAQVLIIEIAGFMGIWLFYIQHQFEDVYWARRGEWDFVTSALHGASYYRLPALLQWFSGNIGFHTLHHLNSRIPNYNLEGCFSANPVLQQYSRTITLKQSLKCIRMNLWDEQSRKMVSFADLRNIA